MIPKGWTIEHPVDFAKISTGDKDTQNKVNNGKYPFYVRSATVEKIDSYSYEGPSVLTVGDGVGTGKVFHYTEGKFDFHQRVYKISDFKKYVYPKYFYYCFSKNFIRQVVKYTAKTSVDSVRIEMISKMKILLPPFGEQKRIVEILSIWDQAIEKLEKFISVKEKQKRGLMQQLLTGKKRFKEFSNEIWDTFTLDEVGDFSKGKGISKNEVSVTGFPCVRYGEIYTNHHFYIKKYYSFISEPVSKTSKKLNYGDILFTGSGETLEEIGKSVAFLDKKESYAGSDIIVLSPNQKKFNSLFLGFYLNSQGTRRQIHKLAQGQSIVHIYQKDLKTLKFKFPSIKEQQKIAETLMSFDKEIRLLKERIRIVKRLKKGLMQQLLTGKIRLQ